MALGKPLPKSGVDEENPYWMSFSDILSALLVIFILASVVLILQLMERKQEFDDEVKMLERAEQVRRTILEEARAELLTRGIQVEISENDSVLRIPNELLGFESGEFELHRRYASTALDIGEVLDRVISTGDRAEFLDTIFVEGHTDNRGYQGLLGKGNWGLSTFRAISLWEFWIQTMPQERRLDRFKNSAKEPLFSVSGYADTRPVTRGESETDLRRNRRIDIRFTIRRPESSDYKGVESILGGDQ